MVDRVSTSAIYTQIAADMQRSLLNYNKISQQLGAGSRVTNITDDPIAAVNILNTNRQLGQMDTFATNVSMSMSELSALDDLMELATGYLSTAWDKAIQANNQTYQANSLEALKVEIDELTKTMVDLANTEYNDNFIFGGANTKITTFTIEDNGDIVYHGTPKDDPRYIRQTEIADGVFEVINTTGDKVFGYYKSKEDADGNKLFTYTDEDGNEYNIVQKIDETTGKKTYEYEDGTAYNGELKDLQPQEECIGVMGALRKLSNGIQRVLDGDAEGGYAEMHSTLDMFAKSMDTITKEQTKFGGVYNRLEMSESTLETNTESLTEYLSQIQDVDLTTAITDWMQAQYAYQASLQIASSTMGMSLLNYL